MITDDFQVLPMSTMTCLTLLKEIGAVDESTIKEKCINIGKDEVLKLLVCSLTSMSPFSETVLESPVNKTSTFAFRRVELSPRSTTESQRGMDTTRSKEARISLKLIINKCNNMALYAEAEKDFVDLICSFLTFPLGYFFHKFPSLSLNGCLGNLYKSIKDLDVDKYLESEEMKATLVDPKLAPGIAHSKQFVLIKEALHPSWSTVESLYTTNWEKSSKSLVDTIGEGFMKEPSMFMVTDNLTITPLSPISGLSLINKLNIPMSEIVEREVTICEEEALCLLEAALVSSCALTDAFILKEPKQEPQVLAQLAYP
ncbi:uncharacterized protein LOC132294415 [Cornus florida]|uniref:uncharacterized protein LOC132294415 n=1 Tax=Cornus florida TaxID=4283 RepID=UPI00289E7D81|nr:uncharacterized protein LOC132294415 [Cornus florida]